MSTIPQRAAEWALQKVGCPYSQKKRTQEGIFDCSSLVARAYMAQGKKWYYGGTVPNSTHEVYDDDFELLWPDSYSQIGKCLGGNSIIRLARSKGDLQFICTDSSTTRSNRITHVTMVAGADTIVHARGTKYGVCTNAIDLYAGKICAILRYNPSTPLRLGMCGWRTLALQRALNANGAKLSENGEFGAATQNAVLACQRQLGQKKTGVADTVLLQQLGLVDTDTPDSNDADDAGRGDYGDYDCIEVTADSVNVRSGPGTNYSVAFVAHKGDRFTQADTSGWLPIRRNGALYWVSSKYVSSIASTQGAKNKPKGG